jgi:glutathione synthase/RimK-type ligase-like ATP-grasp enzyme
MLTPAADYGVPWAWAFDVQAAALREAGAEVTARSWTEAGDLTVFDLVLPLVTWGYHQRPAEWLAFLDRLDADSTRIANPSSVLRWNSDKAYLAQLAAAGVATIPTLAVDHLNEAALAAAHGVLGTDRLVVKPPVSASAWGTFRLGPADPVPEEVHGARMLIQPWLESVVGTGEYSMIFFAGEFSHAVIKRAKPGDFRVQPEHGGTTEGCDPPSGAVAIARAALAQAPASTTYARVDFLQADDGALQIIELELIEPALFLEHGDGAKSKLAEAVLARARTKTPPLEREGR